MATPSRHVDRLDAARGRVPAGARAGREGPPAPPPLSYSPSPFRRREGRTRGSSRPQGNVLGYFNPPGLILLW